ncbi:right-handed parallel beta-helix repeat-containing protein [Alkalicoccobacillus gibsonii]|uniref:right-handed parallel beta-helix repeat-containing protein n=1 Tax=Alkalicoccobacillus gibsonii TaxID=79881 RepID=UPI003F7B6696
MEAITVSQKILSKYKNVKQALELVEEGGTIHLDKATYKGKFFIHKSVTICGAHAKDSVVLEGSFVIKDGARVTIKNMTLQDDEVGVFVQEGSLTLENCDINRMSETALMVKKGSHATLRDVIIQNNQHAILSQGKVQMHFCALSNQQATQVILYPGANLKSKHTHILQGKKEAILLKGQTNVTLEDCSIFGHSGEYAQIRVQKDAELHIKSSRIYESTSGGIDAQGGRLLLNDVELYRNVGTQVKLEDSTATISHSSIHSADIGCVVSNGSTLQLEQSQLTAHLQAQLHVSGGALHANHCSIRGGKSNAILVTECGEADIADSEIADHFLPQICVSEQGHARIERSSIHHGEHYGVWLTEQSSASILQSNIHGHQQIQVVVAEQSYLEMDTSSVYEGYENGMHFLEESKGLISHCEVYRHGAEFPQVIVREGADPHFKQCTISESPSNAVWFLEHAKGQVEQCTIVGHGLAQLEITGESTPHVSRTTITEGGHCAIHIHESAPVIEECLFPDHIETIILEGNCAAEIVGQGAEVLADYAAFKRHEEERLSNLDEKTLERIQKAEDLAEKEARTAEIVGLVEELERRLGTNS